MRRLLLDKNRLFFVLMAVSSATALLRGFLIAYLLEPGAFGAYALLFALGAYGASLLSFGLIERTFKRFPRLFIDGHPKVALVEADGIAERLFWRALLVALLGAAILWLVGKSAWTAAIVYACGLALGIGGQSAYISVHRASGELAPLGAAALSRSLLALLFASLGALAASWPGAMVGEVAAALLGAWISRMFAHRTVERAARPPVRPADLPQNDLWLFASFLLASLPLYVDRSVVSLLFGNAAAGTYGLLMLFVAGMVTLVSVVSQKLGPQLVQLEHVGARFRAQIGLLARWISALAALAVAGMACAGALLLYGPLAQLGVKYGLTPSLVVAATMMCVGQVSHLMEWSLLSRDREKLIFVSTVLYLFILASSVGFLAWVGGSLLELMWALAVSKLFNVALLGIFLLWSHRKGLYSARRGEGLTG